MEYYIRSSIPEIFFYDIQITIIIRQKIMYLVCKMVRQIPLSLASLRSELKNIWLVRK
ncbi:MAG: hypothetical protein UX23_C0017G0004 [Parcubacteria group bacterium GW2011_GWB1_45_9]|nr:MAG: hypothetical protein UX23_C0017G0004 [Parcubacteria group bacterium GW2011_GWB1_45_9]